MDETRSRMVDAVRSQYHAALEMLRLAVVRCPEGLWDDKAFANRFWHVAYHALYYTHLYLQPTADDFSPWGKDRQGYSDLGRPPDGPPYTVEEILEYHALCRQQVEEQVGALDLAAPSGFRWLRFDKLELQFYNIRHVQQHVGELCERLGVAAGVDVDWVGAGRG